MRSLSNPQENTKEEWDSLDQALHEARPEPPPLSQARSQAILENALAQSARPRAPRTLPFFTSLIPVTHVSYGIAGSVAAMATVSLLFWVQTAKTVTVPPEPVRTVIAAEPETLLATETLTRDAQTTNRDAQASDSPAVLQDALNIPIMRPAAPKRVHHAERRNILVREMREHERYAVRVTNRQALPLTRTEPETIEATVTPQAIRAYYAAAFLPTPDAPPPQEAPPRLLVVVTNEEPELSLAVHNTTTTERGYAEASAVHQAADGSLVWERCTLQTGAVPTHFFRVLERGSHLKDGPMSSPQNNLRHENGAPLERPITIPEIPHLEDIENEHRYTGKPPLWAGFSPHRSDWADYRFGSAIARLCSGGAQTGSAFPRSIQRQGPRKRAEYTKRDVGGSDAAGQRPSG